MEPVKILLAIEKMTRTFTIPLEVVQDKLKLNPFQIMISIILSARTKDTTTAKICKVLFKKISTPSDLDKMPLSELIKIIHPTGFFNEKARNIKNTAKILTLRPFPKTKEELLDLPGIGPKTAALYLSKVLGTPAVCVDTHVRRISNYLGLNSPESDSAELTEKNLMRIFPKKYWGRINSAFVKFGQNICLPRHPHCHLCSLTESCVYFKKQSVK